ncbi:MAG: hypothetical protein HYZ28_07405 [Myxococcales bacterium]|nr:hypothetical protein [Myxococcales bacterium]
MTATTRLGLLAALGLLLSACPPPPTKGDGGVDAGTEDCIEDADCPDPNLFYCNQSTSKCEPACRTKNDCTAEVRKDWALDYCGGNLGCQCDEGKCVASLCSADPDCGSQVCRNGACTAAPAESSITSCQVTPDYVVLRAGAKAKFYLSAWDSAKNPVVPKTGVTWSALTAAVTGSGTGLSAEFTGAAANTSAEDAVQAKIGGATCKAKVLVLPGTVPANNVDVLVVDELSGRPVQGASILASVPTTGATIGAVGTTDAKGYARLNITGGQNLVSVSAFHDDYNYLTIANYDMSTSSPDARFLAMALRRNQVDKFGGYKGTFNGVPATPNVHAGIAGMSLAGSITDLSIAQLLGPSVPTHVKIGTAIDKADVPLPAGVYLGFTDTVIKKDISAQGLAGTCTDASGAPREAEILSGSCGTRTAWALAGDVPLGDLPIDAFASGTSNIDFGAVLGKIIPIFRRFNSSISRDVQFTLKTTPRKTNGDPDFSNVTEFTPVNHDFAQVPLAFSFVVRSPDLPQFKGAYVDGAMFLGGALVSGRGVVPLGMGAAVNQNTDAKTDLQAGLAAPGLVQLRMAPTHHGIEGTDYGVVALALSLKSANDASAGIASSAVMGRVPGNRIAFDPTGSTVVDLPSPYLKFPENAKYNFTNTAQGALPPRTFKFASDPGLTGTGGATVVRVVFTDNLDHRWVVYLSPAQATTGFALPPPPGTFADRTFYTGSTTGSRAPILVQAIRLTEDPSKSTAPAISYEKLVELNSFNSDRMVDFTTGFVFIDYGRPEVDWLTPKDANSTVAAASAIKVKVSAFKVGTAATDDGYVKVTFTGGNASCTAVDGKTDASQGKGEISMNLPAGCTGSNVTMTATLYGQDNQAIKPPAASSITVNIQ